MSIAWRKRVGGDPFQPVASGRRSYGRRRGHTTVPVAEALEGRPLLTFPTVVVTGSGPDPTALVVSDFNGDGIPDIAVTSAGASTVGVLTIQHPQAGQPLNFLIGPEQFLPTLSPPSALTAADLNGDGKPDLVAAGAGSVGSLYLNAAGSFPTTPTPVGNSLGHNLTGVAAGDFNNDGKTDVAFTAVGSSNNQQTSSTLGSVDVSLNGGGGAFPSSLNVVGAAATGHDPVAIVSGDFNRDGKAEVAVVNQSENTLSVYLNAPNFTGPGAFFQLKGSFGTGNRPTSVAVGDFNGDHDPDFVVGSQDGRVAVIMGKGDGSIQSDQLLQVSGSISGVTVGDFNGDGKLDIATANNDATSSVSVLLGNGNGTFQAPLQLASGGINPTAIAAGDFLGNGRTDLALAFAGSSALPPTLNGNVGILINDGVWPALTGGGNNPGGGGSGPTASARSIGSSVSAPTSPAFALPMPADTTDVSLPWAPSAARHKGPVARASTSG